MNLVSYKVVLGSKFIQKKTFPVIPMYEKVKQEKGEK